MSKIKVLIVDDAYFMRNLLRKALKEADYEVVGEAKNGKEGITMYFELKPDIVTMDINMPDISGIEATKQILSKDSKAKIIAVTGNSDAEVKKQIMEAGVKDYLSKPFQPAFLWNKLENILNEEEIVVSNEIKENKSSVISNQEIEDNFDDMEFEILNKPDESKTKTLVIENSEDIIEFPENFKQSESNLLNEENVKKIEEEKKLEEENIRLDKDTKTEKIEVSKILYEEKNEEIILSEKDKYSEDKTQINQFNDKEDIVKNTNSNPFSYINIKPPRGKFQRNDYQANDDSDDIEEPVLNVSEDDYYNNKNNKNGIFNKVKKLFKK
ncbi:MAG: two-component system response regulator [Clostridiaceae bacterium]|nr:two-component system response regulator [Clostridiaceae bacterium]